MIEVVDVLLAVVASSVGVFFLRAYQTGIGMVRRIVRQETLHAADVKPGPAELAGVLRAAGEPLMSLSGQPAVAIKRTQYHTYQAKNDSDGYRTLSVTRADATRVELTDASGTCLLDLDRVLLFGPTSSYAITGANCKAKHPEIWRQVSSEHADGVTIEAVYIEETIIPDGITGFVSGTAEASDELAPGDDYRGVGRRLKLTGEANRPLIVSAYDEATVLEMLRAPLKRMVIVACVTFAIGAAAIAIPWLVAP